MSECKSPTSQMMDGSLFIYGPPKEGGSNGLVAFRRGTAWKAKTIVHIAGLCDGLLSMPWLGEVAARAERVGWGFVQPVLSSTNLGYGVSSLRQDVEELDQLFGFLLGRGVQSIALLGHSTGSQDTVMCMKDSLHRNHLAAAILVGPLSDREGMMLERDTALFVEKARRMAAEGRASELMPRACGPAPITAERYLSLADIGGDDDLFSSDLPEEELRERVGHLARVPTFIVISTRDEYIPHFLDPEHLAERLSRATGNSSTLLIDDNHTISDPANHAKLAESIVAFLLVETS
ncbi:UPF0613 protein PB24D3.06c [Diplonema papillatum]|nr:UPF0613 protein PB24D3.06c [Diplonema papillatum]|eukprot:gene12853-19810_t